MNISLDAGALCSPSRFGNAIFTDTFLRSLGRYDRAHEYTAYAFCQKPRLTLYKNITWKRLSPTYGWMSLRLSVEELLYPQDIFLALNQSMPAFTRARIFSFSHGLSFFYYPFFYGRNARPLMKQVEAMVKKSECILVSSQKVKQEFEDVFPQRRKVIVLPFGVPLDMIPSRQKARSQKKYFLFVGMNAEIKNIEFLTKTIKRLTKEKKYKDYRLYLCGDFLQQDFDPQTTRCFFNPGRTFIRKLYQGATAYVCSSWYESFNYPVLEALSLGCPVIGLQSSIIPEMRPFVSTAKDSDTFLDLMRIAVKGRLHRTESRRINELFSWKKYITALTSLYD